MGLRGDCSRSKLRLAQAADGKADHGRPIGHSPVLVIAEVVGFKGGRSENLGQARPNMHAALRLGRRKRAPGARKEIAADSVDAVERGHDISYDDPGRCLGAKHEPAAEHRFRHRAFRQRRCGLFAYHGCTGPKSSQRTMPSFTMTSAAKAFRIGTAPRSLSMRSFATSRPSSMRLASISSL